ncbi:MAG: hypothetical protein GXP26_12940 [Planctomycetes bacterium]|nr:hypothetical protein [Planctomycetota bacterium]
MLTLQAMLPQAIALLFQATLPEIRRGSDPIGGNGATNTEKGEEKTGGNVSTSKKDKTHLTTSCDDWI